MGSCMKHNVLRSTVYCAVIYLVDISECPDFNTMYELYDPCTVMFFFRNKVCTFPSTLPQLYARLAMMSQRGRRTYASCPWNQCTQSTPCAAQTAPAKWNDLLPARWPDKSPWNDFLCATCSTS